eukprot:scaffold1827_cov421-Prasinococcus_capsulatus_cf.AAC.23
MPHRVVYNLDGAELVGQVPKIVELRAPHAARADLLDLKQVRAVQGKLPLDRHPVEHVAQREGRAESPVPTRDTDTLEGGHLPSVFGNDQL